MEKQERFHAFINTVYSYYGCRGRDLPWRATGTPYHILVSELMLQQTQVVRVLKKYDEFLRVFPDPYALADAPLSAVLKVWQGLGYNRRARYLWLCAQKIVDQYNGSMPTEITELTGLPGVGRATAGAIMVFAYNKPVVFIETNIRTVFLYFFFNDRTGVKDSEIFPLIEETLDHKNPRHWYYALMDYGVYLKGKHRRVDRISAHYKKQPPFKGSRRQARGLIVKFLLAEGEASIRRLVRQLGRPRGEVSRIAEDLAAEGIIVIDKNTVRLS